MLMTYHITTWCYNPEDQDLKLAVAHLFVEPDG